MEDYTQEQLEEESASLLKELGLTNYEAYVLVYLFRLGTATAKDVASMDHVPRTRVYDAIDSLHAAGLVDIQYSSPRRFTPVSRETTIRKLGLERDSTIEELSVFLSQLEPVGEHPTEFGVWTVSGSEAVTTRVLEYIDTADEEIIYMAVDELVTDDHLERLEEAEERGVEIYIAGVSDPVLEDILSAVPSATTFETLWEWSDVGAGSLLITDRRTVLVSVLVDRETRNAPDEVAIWGTGAHNSLVVVFRAIFTWRLDDEEYRSLSA